MRPNSDREEDFDFDNSFEVLETFAAELGDENQAALIRTLACEAEETDEATEEEPAEEDDEPEIGN